MAYNVGSAAVSILPDFSGIAQKIDQQAGQWGTQASKAFSSSFNDGAKRGTSNSSIGPSDSSTSKQGDSSGGKFADSFKSRVEAAIKSLPDINLDADTTEAEEKISVVRAMLEELASQRIGIDVDESTAVAALAELKAQLDEIGASSPSARVQVDTAAASAKLAEFQAEIEAVGAEDVSVNVNDGGSIESLGGDLGGLSTALVALAPLAIPAGAALAAAFAGALTVIGAVGAGIGVAALGLSGVSKAVGLLNQQKAAESAPATGGGGGGDSAASAEQQVNADASLVQAERALQEARADAANAAITADEQVKNSRQGLADAVREANQQQINSDEQVKNAETTLANTRSQVAAQSSTDASAVVTAEEGVRTAQQASLTAQQALNDAREQAARDLETYADNAADANLNVRQAGIDVSNAQQTVNADLAPGSTATPAQITQDVLNYQKALQAQTEAQQQATNATADNNKAQKEGINGAPGVVSAQDGVTTALNNQITAAQNLTKAQHKQFEDSLSGAKQVKIAQQGVADAERTANQQRITSAENVQKAEQGITDALRAQAVQARQSANAIKNAQAGVGSAQRAKTAASAPTGGGSSGAGAVSALAGIDAQLAKVNPATLQFAKFIQGQLAPAFDKLKGAAAAGLLPGLEQALKSLAPLAGPLTKFVSSLAGTLGDLAKQASKALTGPFWTQFFGWVSATAGPTLKTFVGILEGVGKGFAGLIEAFGPVTAAIGKGLSGLAKSFGDFGATAGNKNSPFQAFLGYVKQYGPAVAGVLGNLFKAFGNLVKALAPLGGVMIKALDGLSKFLAKLTPTELLAVIGGIAATVVALGAAFDAIPIIAGAVAVAVLAAAGLIAANWSKIKPVIQPVLDAFSAVWSFIKNQLIPVLEVDLAQAWDGLKKGLQTIGNALQAHQAQWNTLKNILAAVANFIVTKIVPLYGPILKEAFKIFGDSIAGVIDEIAWLINALTNVVNAGIAAGKWFAGPFVDFFTGAYAAVKGAISTAISDVIGFFTALPGDISDAVTAGIATLTAVGASIVAGVLSGIKAAVNFGGQVIDWLANTISTAFTGAANWGLSIGKTLIADVLTAVKAVVSFGGDVVTWIGNAISTAFTAAASWGTSIGKSIVSAIVDAIKAVLTFGGDVINWIASAINTAFTTTVTWGAAIGKAIADAIVTAVKAVVSFGGQIIDWISSTIYNALTSAVSWGGNIGSKILALLKSAITDSTKFGGEVLTWISTALTGAMKSAESDFEGVGSSILHAIGNGISKAIDWLKDKILNPLIDAINSTIGKIPGFPNIPPFTDGSSSSSSDPPGKSHALGGTAPGYAPGQDSLWARVSPGEGFIVPEAVRGLGGAAAIQAINAAFSPRVSAPGFSLGGVIGGGLGKVGGAIGAAGGLVTGIARAGAADVANAALSGLELPIRAALSAAPSGVGAWASGLLDGINAAVNTFIAGHPNTNAPAGGSSGAPAGPVPKNLQQYDHQYPMHHTGTPGISLSPTVIAAIAQAANLPGVTFAQIAHGESAYMPGIVEWPPEARTGAQGYGLWQITTHVGNEDVIAQVGGLSALLDPITNARAAKLIYDRQGIGAWHGSHYLTDPDLDYTGQKFDSGGFLAPGVTMAINNTGKPEPVFTSAQAASLTGPGNASPMFEVRVLDGAVDSSKIQVIARGEIQKNDRGNASVSGAGFPGRGGGFQPTFGHR